MTSTHRRRDRVLQMWQQLRAYLGGMRQRADPIGDPRALAAYLDSRASFVAQTSLYGYLRTRAGMRFPELFDDDVFVVSINIAKWQVWLACLSDLAVYAGGLLSSTGDPDTAGHTVIRAVDSLLESTGVPADAGPDFAREAARVRERLASCDWAAVTDDEAAFSESPAALVRWAPVVEELKALDEGIVRNSVRFRWQEVRRELRRRLDAQAVLASV